MFNSSLFRSDDFGDADWMNMHNADDEWYNDDATPRSVLGVTDLEISRPAVSVPVLPLHATIEDRSNVSDPLMMAPASFAAGFEYPPQISSEPRPRRKNKIKKGEGVDSKPDLAGRDNYNYERGYFYPVLRSRIRKSPSMALRVFCKAIHAAFPYGLSLWNRCVTRRIACGYCWLDENRHYIPETLVESCISQLKTTGLFLTE
jgi:hypothetical protein